MEQVNPLTRFRCDTCFRRAVVYRMDLTRIHLTRIHLTRIPFDRLSRTSTRTLSSRKSSCRSSRATRSASSSSASTTSARPVSLSSPLFDPHGTRICLARRPHPLYLCLTHIDIVVSHPCISPVCLTRISAIHLTTPIVHLYSPLGFCRFCSVARGRGVQDDFAARGAPAGAHEQGREQRTAWASRTGGEVPGASAISPGGDQGAQEARQRVLDARAVE